MHVASIATDYGSDGTPLVCRNCEPAGNLHGPANRSSFGARSAHLRAMVGNLQLDYERRLVDQTGIEPVTS